MTKEERARNIGLLCFSIALGIICFVVSRIGEGTPFAICRMFGYMSVYCAATTAVSLLLDSIHTQRKLKNTN